MTRLDYESKVDRSSGRRLLPFSEPSTVLVVAGVTVVMGILSDPHGFRFIWTLLLLLCGGWYVLARIVRSDADWFFKVVKSLVAVPVTLIGVPAAVWAWPDSEALRVYGWTYVSSGQAAALRVLGLCVAVYGLVRLVEKVCEASDRRATREEEAAGREQEG